MADKPKILKTELFRNEAWNLIISSYPFTVEKTDEDWVSKKNTFDLVEISKTKKVWSDELKWYFEKKSFVTLWLNDFKDILRTLEVETL